MNLTREANADEIKHTLRMIKKDCAVIDRLVNFMVNNEIPVPILENPAFLIIRRPKQLDSFKPLNNIATMLTTLTRSGRMTKSEIELLKAAGFKVLIHPDQPLTTR